MSTDDLIELLDSLTYEELDELSDMIKDRKKRIENKAVIKDIKKLLGPMQCVCAWNLGRVHSIDPMPPNFDVLAQRLYSHIVDSKPATFIGPGIRLVHFPLFVGIIAPDHKFENWKIDELEKDQHHWVKYVECDYEPVKEDKDYLVNLDWDLNCEKYGLTDTYGTGTLYIEVYYKVSPVPKSGSEFKCFDSNGNIKKWEIRDNKLYVQNEDDKKCDVCMGSADDWYKYNMFVLDLDLDLDDENETGNNVCHDNFENYYDKND